MHECSPLCDTVRLYRGTTYYGKVWAHVVSFLRPNKNIISSVKMFPQLNKILPFDLPDGTIYIDHPRATLVRRTLFFWEQLWSKDRNN